MDAGTYVLGLADGHTANAVDGLQPELGHGLHARVQKKVINYSKLHQITMLDVIRN